MPTQRQNSAARSPNVPEKQLQDCSRTDDLHTLRMLRPSHGVTNRSSLLRSRGGSKRFRCFQKHFFRHSAIAFDHLRGVSREMTFQHLEDAARMFQRRISFKLARILRFSAAIFAVSAACV